MSSDPDLRRRYWFAVACVALACGAIAVDLPIARWIETKPFRGDIKRLLTWSELFAHGLGVAVVGLTVFVLDVPRRWQIPRLLASAFVPGLLASLAKLTVGRIRPGHFDLERGVFATFIGGFPTILGIPPQFDYGAGLQSLPSGHTATAVGLAVGLGHVYPRGRWLFAGFAVLAASQRIAGGAHYLSDTLVGAAIGFLGAAWVASPRLLGRPFSKLERRLRKPPPPR